MKVDLGIWNRLTQVVIVLVALAVIILIIKTYLPLIQQNERMRHEIDRLTTEQTKQSEIARQLRAEFEALRNDPKTVERLAREKLRYAKPDETVFIFEPPATNAPRR